MPRKLVAQEVNFATKRKPKFACDLCIVEGLGLGRRTHARKSNYRCARHNIRFLREKESTCPDCKQVDVMVIRAVENAACQLFKLNFETIVIEFGKVSVKIVK